jgi:hypothetical protein
MLQINLGAMRHQPDDQDTHVDEEARNEALAGLNDLLTSED